jgi:spermidine synthase
MLGTALAIWLSGSALGSFIYPILFNRWGGLKSFEVYAVILINLSFFLAINSPILFHLKSGTYPTILESIPIMLITIFPAANICGALFPYMIKYFPLETLNSSAYRINTIYLGESFGAFFSGLLLNLLFFNSFNNLQNLSLATIVFLLFSLMGRHPVQQFQWNRILKFVLIIFQIIILIKASDIITQINDNRYSPYQVRSDRDTPYGNIKILEYSGQNMILEQGKILYTMPDLLNTETHMLLPLLSLPKPEHILIVGGNLKDHLNYMTKFESLKTVTYLEQNSFLADLQKNMIQSDQFDFRLQFVSKDLRALISESYAHFDLICLNLNEPINLAQNRYFTKDFFALIKKSLRKDGLLFFSIQSSENYLNPHLCNYINLLKNSLSSIFTNIFIVPGDENYFFSGDSRLITKLPDIWQKKLSELNIKTTYINTAYLKYRISDERISAFNEQLRSCDHELTNTDFNIKGYLYHFGVWSPISGGIISNFFNFLKKARLGVLVFFVGFLVLINLILRNQRKSKLIWHLMIFSGISISLEIIILLQYQIMFGSLYSAMAMIFGLYMFGLAAGSWFLQKKSILIHLRKRRSVFYLSLLIVTSLLYLPIILDIHLYHFSFVHEIIQFIFIPLIIFATGFLTGGFFVYTTQQYYLQGSKQSGITYSADLAGAVPAALLITTFIIPNFGLPISLLIIASILIIEMF